METSKQGGGAQDKPIVEPTPNGPYLVKNLTDFRNSREEPIQTRAEMYLCRSGGSASKPFCDGTHWHIKFFDDKN